MGSELVNCVSYLISADVAIFISLRALVDGAFLCSYDVHVISMRVHTYGRP